MTVSQQSADCKGKPVYVTFGTCDGAIGNLCSFTTVTLTNGHHYDISEVNLLSTDTGCFLRCHPYFFLDTAAISVGLWILVHDLDAYHCGMLAAVG